jgi:hypothetical protein
MALVAESIYSNFCNLGIHVADIGVGMGGVSRQCAHSQFQIAESPSQEFHVQVIIT